MYTCALHHVSESNAAQTMTTSLSLHHIKGWMKDDWRREFLLSSPLLSHSLILSLLISNGEKTYYLNNGESKNDIK